MTRKVRLNPSSLIGTGFAGDMTTARPPRTEDSWSYFHKAIDSPTYARFASHMAATATCNPAARRAAAAQEHVAVAQAREIATVVSLGAWEGELGRAAAAVAPKPAPAVTLKKAAAKK